MMMIQLIIMKKMILITFGITTEIEIEIEIIECLTLIFLIQIIIEMLKEDIECIC